MAMHRQLSALLYELQGADSPLAKAKVLARAWRTVRELSPPDRRLLAREAGFAGAEEILEGLAKRRGGFAPALLLELLGNARGSGGESVEGLLDALRGRESAVEVATRAVEVAADLIEGPASGPATGELNEGLDRLTEVGFTVERTAEEALAALQAIETVGTPPAGSNTVGERAVPQPETSPAPAATAFARPTLQPRRRAAPGWDLLAKAGSSSRSRPPARGENSAEPGPAAASSFAAPEVLAALGAQESLLSRLLVLRRELASFAGSGRGTLQQLVESFPDGWPRRRAVVSLLEGGLAAEPADALAVVAALGREHDRGWCLTILAERGLLRGAQLERALALLGSPALRRRLGMVARTF
jgi:hypothetical protein